jgi:hypothetical protein
MCAIQKGPTSQTPTLNGTKREKLSGLYVKKQDKEPVGLRLTNGFLLLLVILI